jgi:hypothetical protein
MPLNWQRQIVYQAFGQASTPRSGHCAAADWLGFSVVGSAASVDCTASFLSFHICAAMDLLFSNGADDLGRCCRNLWPSVVVGSRWLG